MLNSTTMIPNGGILSSAIARQLLTDHLSIPLRACPEESEGKSLGSSSIIVNGSGVRIWEDRYLPYGDIRYHSDTVTNTVQTQTLRCTQGYTGQWLEEGLAARREGGLDRGLYFYGARWYDANLGRFVQPDTIVPEPGNPQSLNRYAYVLNNPLRYTDPTGMFTEEEIMKYLGVKTRGDTEALLPPVPSLLGVNPRAFAASRLAIAPLHPGTL